MRYILVSPHLTSRSGGIKWIVRCHKALLSKGLDSYIITPDGEASDWLTNNCTATRWDAYVPQKEDKLFVFTNSEDCDFAFQFDVDKYYISLGHTFFGPEACPSCYGEEIFVKEKWPWTGIIALSQYGKECLEEYGWKIPVILDYNDGIFHPETKIPNTIAFFPRRNGSFIERKIMPLYQHLDWISLEDMIEPEIAALLSTTEFFVGCSTGVGETFSVTGKVRPSGEGWGLGSWEALCSGCLITAFPAIGGKTFLNSDNCYLVPDYNEEIFVEQFVDMIENRTGTRDAKLAAASHSLKDFTEIKFIEKFLEAVHDRP